MSTRAAAVVALLAAAACGAPAAPAPAPASAPPPDVKAPSRGHPRPTCTPVFVRRAPEGWVEAGRIVVTREAERATDYALYDAAGSRVAGGPLAEGERYLDRICAIRGVAAYAARPPPADGEQTLSVLRPAREDESADLRILCREPMPMSSQEEETQRRIALDTYPELLTSPRWRGWLYALAADAVDRGEGWRRARRERARELADAARSAGIADCWYAALLAR